VKWLIALSLTLLAARVTAATAYVSDELVLGVYSEQNNQGQRLTTLHSGASVETLAVNGDFTQVRLNDGTIGWVKSAYLTTQEPAVVRIKQLQDELDRSRATTPALAEAAARSELEQLKRELAAKQAELMAANAMLTPPEGSAAAAGSVAAAGAGARAATMASRTAASSARAWIEVAATLASLMVGFCLGYATLARRIRHKYGGLKVY
jgi:SH3 domain protein